MSSGGEMDKNSFNNVEDVSNEKFNNVNDSFIKNKKTAINQGSVIDYTRSNEQKLDKNDTNYEKITTNNETSTPDKDHISDRSTDTKLHTSEVVTDGKHPSAENEFDGLIQETDAMILKDKKTTPCQQPELVPETVAIKPKKVNVPVDEHCTWRGTSSSPPHVFIDGEVIYDATMNNTVVKLNKNRQYFLQLLETDEKQYCVWTRHGRVGKGYIKGQKVHDFGSDKAKATKKFKALFREKTKNSFPVTFADFQWVHGKYHIKDIDYEEENTEDGDPSEREKMEKITPMDPRLRQLLELICCARMREVAAKKLDFDTNLSPLGVLTQRQIQEGSKCLKKVMQLINDKKNFGADFDAALDHYYTLIPHLFKYRTRPSDDKVFLKKEYELLNFLEDAVFICKETKKESCSDKDHPVEKHYDHLCELLPINEEEQDFKDLVDYVRSTQVHEFTMEVKHVFKVNRTEDREHEETMNAIGNRMWLWHGSKPVNFFRILRQGLRLTPPEVQLSGTFFGRGIYFANMSSKSGQYCVYEYPEANDTGLLLVAEVAMGEMDRRKAADSTISIEKLNADGYNSVHGQGDQIPPAYRKINEFITVPKGEMLNLHEDPNFKSALNYDEYVVYDEKQVQIRYLVQVTFHEK